MGGHLEVLGFLKEQRDTGSARLSQSPKAVWSQAPPSNISVTGYKPHILTGIHKEYDIFSHLRSNVATK